MWNRIALIKSVIWYIMNEHYCLENELDEAYCIWELENIIIPIAKPYLYHSRRKRRKITIEP